MAVYLSERLCVGAQTFVCLCLPLNLLHSCLTKCMAKFVLFGSMWRDFLWFAVVLMEVTGCSICLAIICIVWFSICEWAHTQCSVVFTKACKKCMRLLPQMYPHAIGSEDFTVFHALCHLSALCVRACAWLSCPVNVAPSQNKTPANCWLLMWCGLPVTWE